MKNLDVAAALFELAELLELKGEGPFKIRAYRKAAEAVQRLPLGIDELSRQGGLLRVPGIGKAIAATIEELLATGVIAQLEGLRLAIPPGVRDLTRVPGLGGKTAMLLYANLGIDSLDRLDLAARQGKLRAVPGIGAQRESAILAALGGLREQGDRVMLGAVRPVAFALADYLRRHSAVLQVEVAGSIRRRREMVEDIDLVVATQDDQAVLDYAAELPVAGDVLERSSHRLVLTTSLGRRVDLVVVPPERFARTLLQMTGSAAHLQLLGDLPDGASEAAIYRAKGLDWIEPELREGRGELEAARTGRLPRLLTRANFTGDLHSHTTASDGTATLLEMAEAARGLGYQYLAICDHSRSLAIARGLTIERLMLQSSEIRRANEAYKDFRLLRGTEVDILKDGSLDFPDDVLADLDVVVASIHSHMRLSSAEQTARLLRAIENPHVDIIGHPTGRLLGRRPPCEFDMDQVIRACVATDTALEISASPARLDLNDVHARMAKEMGVKLVINTDAHSKVELDLLEYGIGQGRRAWLEPADVINTLSLPDLLAWLQRRCAPG